MTQKKAKKVKHFAQGYWGVCPVCHSNDGMINIGKGHWYYCKKHKKCWMIGANIFSGWKDETLAEQRKRYYRLGFDRFEHLTLKDTGCLKCAALLMGKKGAA